MNCGDEPWENLSPPSSASSIASRRVDPEHPWNFYWAKSHDSHLLVFRHEQQFPADRRLPQFQGFRVTNVTTDGAGQYLLMFELLEQEHLELFQRLCTDIVTSTKSAADELTAVEAAIGRTWRWHHLLRGGRDERLSVEEQRGLVGELLTILDTLHPVVGIRSAIDAWTGPIGAPKDFELGTTAIEHKARRSASRPEIRIASEHQLADDEIEELYLVVRDVDQVPREAPGAKCLPQLIDDVLQRMPYEQEIEQSLNIRLAALGYRSTDDYSGTWWASGKRRIFRVHGDFPRLAGSMLPDGVIDVNYTVLMKAISHYEVSANQLEIPHHADKH